jgi:hypothetical protein
MSVPILSTDDLLFTLAKQMGMFSNFRWYSFSASHNKFLV